MTTGETQISRVTRSREAARISYNRICKWYDLFARTERKYNDDGLKKLNVQAGETILEIGFGTGHCIQTLARSAGESGRVYGIDLSDGMCRIARSRVEKAGLSKRTELLCGDATTLPFEANCFDVIFMSFTLELFDTPDIAVVLAECQRVLKKNGRIGIVAMSRQGKQSLIVRFYEWAHEKFPAYIDCRPIFVRGALVNFQILDSVETTLWGLPVEIVVAVNG